MRIRLYEPQKLFNRTHRRRWQIAVLFQVSARPEQPFDFTKVALVTECSKMDFGASPGESNLKDLHALVPFHYVHLNSNFPRLNKGPAA